MVMTRKFDKKDVIPDYEAGTSHLPVRGSYYLSIYDWKIQTFETADFSKIGRIRCGAAPASLVDYSEHTGKRVCVFATVTE